MNRDYDDIDPVEYDKSYTVVPREMYLKEYWLPLLEDAIGRYCKDKYVLDLGCGYGIYARMISKYTDNITGIDILKDGWTLPQNNALKPSSFWPMLTIFPAKIIPLTLSYPLVYSNT